MRFGAFAEPKSLEPNEPLLDEKPAAGRADEAEENGEEKIGDVAPLLDAIETEHLLYDESVDVYAI